MSEAAMTSTEELCELHVYDGLDKLVVQELSLCKKNIKILENKLQKMDDFDMFKKHIETRIDIMEKINNTTLCD